MEIKQWINSMQILLKEIKNIDFGYPIGDNFICVPENDEILDDELVKELIIKTGINSTSSLISLYTHCEFVNLPDIFNGYFINPIDRVLWNYEHEGPIKISEPYCFNILIFGRYGDGGLFGARIGKSEEILYLHGSVRNLILDGENSIVKVIASSFDDFLKKLLADVEAFIHKEEKWKYMV